MSLQVKYIFRAFSKKDEMKCVFFLFVCEDLVVKTRVPHKQWFSPFSIYSS
jgi:hypothetical protein